MFNKLNDMNYQILGISFREKLGKVAEHCELLNLCVLQSHQETLVTATWR